MGAYICFLATSTALGQEQIARIVEFENTQLTTGSIAGVCKDHQGFIWIGSDYSGLSRFDGNTLEHFTESSHGLYSNSAIGVVATPDSMLLIIYHNYINQTFYVEFFDPVRHKVYTLSDYIQQDLPFDVKEKKLRVATQPDGSLFFFDEKNVWEYKDKKIHASFQLETRYILQMVYKTPQNKIWARAKIRGEKGDAILYINEQGKILAQDTVASVPSYGIGKGETLIFATPKAIYSKEPFAPIREYVFSTLLEYAVLVYNPFSKQVWCFEKKDSKVIHIFDEEGNLIQEAPITAKDFNWIDIESYYFPKENQFLFSRETTIAQLQLMTNKFQRYLYLKESTKRSPSPIRGIGIDLYGTLYMNVYSTSMQNKEGAISNIRDEFGRISNGLFIDSSGLVWRAQNNNAISVYDPLVDTTTIYTYKDNASSPSFHLLVYKDKNQRIWTGHLRGFSYLDPTTGYLDLFKTNEEIKSVFHFYENEKGIWILSASGIYLMDYDYNIIQHYHKEGVGKEFLSYNNIAHLYEDEKHCFWLASKGGGLIYWNPTTGAQTEYRINIKGSDNVLYAVYPDDFGNLWCSSNHGIICFDKSSKDMIFYTEENGITNNEFNTLAHYKGKDGTLYFGSLNGVTAFHPKDLVAPKTTAPLRLISVKIYNNISQKDSIITNNVANTKQIKVLPTDREIKIRFALLDYENTKQIEYAYKLDGLDKQWTSLKKPEINLAGLPYGQYNLLIKAKGSGKKWKEDLLNIEIQVLRPYYFSWWFIALLIGSLLLGVYVFVKLRLRLAQQQQERLQELVQIKTARIQEQTEELKTLDKMKTHFFVNISHELRTPLTLILGPLGHLIDKKETYKDPSELFLQLGLMQRNGDRLLHLIEEILDLAKLDAHKMPTKKQSILLSEFCRWVFSMFESKAALHNIQLEFDYLLANDFYLVTDKRKVEQVLINLIGNALKFTPTQEKILFQVIAKEEEVQFIVKNTGVFIHEEDLPFIFDRFYHSDHSGGGGTGVGLALSKEFAQLLGGDLLVCSTPEEGCIFTFIVPKIEGATPTTFESPEEEWTEDMEVQGPILPVSKFEQDKQVLIVEDNADMQLFIQSLLQETYQTVVLGDGIAAQEYLQKSTKMPDLIISDIMMPRMDGIALLTWLKSEEKTSTIPVVMLTAKAQEDSKLQALIIGVDDYLTKPFSSKELLVRTGNLLRQAALRIEYLDDSDEINDPTDKMMLDGVKENDKIWIKEIEGIVLQIAGESDFDVNKLATVVHINLRTLQRRVKRITGLTLTLYIREVRLQKARNLLERGVYGTIAETAYAAGFGSPYYFSKIYEEHYGKKVSDYFQS